MQDLSCAFNHQVKKRKKGVQGDIMSQSSCVFAACEKTISLHFYGPVTGEFSPILLGVQCAHVLRHTSHAYITRIKGAPMCSVHVLAPAYKNTLTATVLG